MQVKGFLTTIKLAGVAKDISCCLSNFGITSRRLHPQITSSWSPIETLHSGFELEVKEIVSTIFFSKTGILKHPSIKNLHLF